ncbi:hypothetical protein TELCIR_03350 [Teladorsagia circumcincta]|uniref:Uncharacterized protein n=1 Tax=Teladorsagia circumcincta TaxID=45464 RepID=A0A2G9UWL2_TELCI|nr:hypothetical protein TELCIR_03350 [Teladorsagia circumcincta]
MATNCYSSIHRSNTINSMPLMRFIPDADLQFDIVNCSHNDFESPETPPYSHDIYADRSPSVSYPVDLNDIDAALDCDISTLDAYLHSTPCSSSTNANEFPVPKPSSKSVYYCSTHERLSSPDIDPVEEFFPNLPETFANPCPDRSFRRRSHSSGKL